MGPLGLGVREQVVATSRGCRQFPDLDRWNSSATPVQTLRSQLRTRRPLADDCPQAGRDLRGKNEETVSELQEQLKSVQKLDDTKGSEALDQITEAHVGQMSSEASPQRVCFLIKDRQPVFVSYWPTSYLNPHRSDSPVPCSGSYSTVRPQYRCYQCFP